MIVYLSSELLALADELSPLFEISLLVVSSGHLTDGHGDILS